MPSLAFVIPVLDEAAGIEGLLRDLSGRYPDGELIVVDGGSGDQTVARAMRWCDQLLLSERGRAAQMNLGGRVASADYLCFLHADTVPGASAHQFEHCLRGDPQWGFCRVRLSGDGIALRVIEFFMNLRSRLTCVATGDQMLFVRRDVFDATGGFDPIPLMEDVAYSKRLRRRERPLVIRTPVVSSSRRWEERGVARTVLQMWALRLAFFLGVSPQRLWRAYYG
jgi:rSAM/selenodomain-associated transferase 2